MSNGRLFVFGIGGTGARVIRSLTMLLAAGVNVSSEKIIPVMIDLDVQNADTNRTIKALELYKQIRDKAYSEKPSEGFFATNLATLGSERVNDDNRIKESFSLSFGDINETFYEYLKAGQMSRENELLLHLLFDDSPKHSPTTELNLELSVGFKGNPNIGSIIFNDLVNTAEFKYFERSFREGDRIFIISSIFGGTGSSGFPQLVKNLRRSSNNYLRDARIGSVVVMPYFTVEENTGSAIDSRNFISKTKAALSYYESELDRLDAVYYLYDRPGNPYKNNQGGTAQKNDAHLVELLAAMSTVKFANKEDFRSMDTDYYEFGMRSASDNVDFGHFFDQTQREFAVPLTQFQYFAKLFKEHLPENLNKDFAKKLNLNQKLNQDSFYLNLKTFINNHFNEWLQELARNSKSFAPFKFTADFNDLITGKPVETKSILGIGNKGLSEDYFTANLNKKEKELETAIKNPEERFIKTYYQTSKQAFEEKVGGFSVATSV